MRRIQSESEKENKKKFKQVLLGLFLVVILVFSTIGYSFLDGDSDESVNVEEAGLTFYQNGGYWIVQIGEEVFYFENLPNEVSNVSVNGSVDVGQYYGSPLYLVNPTTNSANVLSNIGRYVLRYQEACLEGMNCTGEDLPTKTCEDNVLIFEESDVEEIRVEENCVFIRGYGSRVADAFVYEVLNIE